MDLQKTLGELVAIPSVSSDKEACKKAVEYVKELVEEQGLKTKLYEKDEVYSLLIAKEIKSEYKILFNGHLDVVPASLESFKPIIKREDDKTLMYGRGTSDMKGTDVAVLFAFLESIDEGSDQDMAILFTTDEELGGFNGVGYVAEKGLKADIVFVPDGGNDWSVCTDEKGVFHIRFKAEGVSAHGSRTWLGDNAVVKLIKTYESIRSEFDKKWGEATKDDNWKPTLNLGALNGGNAANKVPNEATMLVDIRYPTPVTQDDLEDIVKKSLVDGVTWEAISTGSPLSIDLDNKYLKEWIKVAQVEELEKESGASDGRFFAQEGIDVILTKPRSSEAHIENEWVDLDDLERFKDVIKEWLKRV
jgi:succinyl-diaminopimelate desuccinylase